MQRYRALERLRQLGGQPVGPLWGLQARGMAAAAQPAPVDDGMIELTVDGEAVRVPKGSNLLQACDAAGKDIPRCGEWPGWAEGCGGRRHGDRGPSGALG
jgi:hypothetical protein